VLLFMHGCPGDVTNSWTFALFATLEERFTVVQRELVTRIFVKDFALNYRR
jgi:hypothetical protein